MNPKQAFNIVFAEKKELEKEFEEYKKNFKEKYKELEEKWNDALDAAEDANENAERLTDDLRRKTEECERLKREVLRLNEELSKFLIKEEKSSSESNTTYGVKTVSTKDRLDFSKLPERPNEREFETNYTIYTDGACLGNGRPGLGYGGWGAVIVSNEAENSDEFEIKLSGSDGPDSTNQIMELTAIKEAVEELSSLADEDSSVTICSDSQYCIKGVTEWSVNWKKNGWINSSGNPVKNAELWKGLLDAIEQSNMTVVFKWVKGHNNHYYNELCDLLATTAAAKCAQENGCHEFDNEIPDY